MATATWHGPRDFAREQLEPEYLNEISDMLLWLKTYVVPIGGMMPFAGSPSPPTNFLQCNGQVVASATYPALSSSLGVLYNTGGEGAGNFRLPNIANLGTNIEWYIRAL